MILKDIISLLNEVARNAHVVDDERIDPRLWQDFIMLKRSQFIKNHLNEKQYIELNTLQIERLTLSAYDSSLDIAGVSIGKKILRTAEVPKMIESRVGPAVYELSTADLISKTIMYVPFDRLRWCGNGTINRNMIFAGFYENRFYVKSGSDMHVPIKYINVTAIYADPTQVSTFDEDTDDYPINDYMINYIQAAILKGEFTEMLKNRSDEINNASGLI